MSSFATEEQAFRYLQGNDACGPVSSPAQIHRSNSGKRRSRRSLYPTVDSMNEVFTHQHRQQEQQRQNLVFYQHQQQRQEEAFQRRRQQQYDTMDVIEVSKAAAAATAASDRSSTVAKLGKRKLYPNADDVEEISRIHDLAIAMGQFDGTFRFVGRCDSFRRSISSWSSDSSLASSASDDSLH